MTDPAVWRDEFPILEHQTHLISHSLGAMPRRTYERLREYAEAWDRLGIRAWEEGWWDLPVTTGDLLAPILGVEPGSVVMHQNVSVAVAVVLSCFDFEKPRNRIVTTDMNFPSVVYVAEAQRRRGAELVVVPSHDGITIDTEELLAAIDERTRVVSVSHVFFRSGFVQDVEAIAHRTHEVGAHLLLDVYQSAGTVPIHARDWGVDFLVGGSVKWLCGGPGAGYLYVRDDLRDRLEPGITGWMAHEHPFDFEFGPQRYAGGIRRFLHGSPAIPALYAARSGYEIVAEIGVERIRSRSVEQTTRMIELADDLGLKVRSPRDPEQRGGTVVIDVEHGGAVVRELQARRILCDHRPDAGIRLSAHFYNTDEEVERALREIRSILDSRAYQRHLTHESAS